MGTREDVATAYALLGERRLSEAEAACRRVIARSGGRDAAAWTALGVVLRELGRAADAEAAYRRAIRAAPGYAAAHHNLGALLSHQERAEEALEALERSRRLGLDAPELYVNLGRVLAQLGRLDQAEDAYSRAVARAPTNALAQYNLAVLRFMRGDPGFLRDIAAAAAGAPRDQSIQLVFCDILRRSGELESAASRLRVLLNDAPASVPARSALAIVLREMGRLGEARSLMRDLVAERPHDPVAIENLVAIELSLGNPDVARPHIALQRRREPNEQRWIAHEATAARLEGDPLYRELYAYERYVRTYDLEPPPGFRSMSELNEALAASLAQRHASQRHPLDQSLRNGTQTTRDLTTDADPAIRAFITALAAPIEEYRSAIGKQGDHPLTSRNRGGAKLRGCWSVLLRRGGFHVNHIHPQGWISSAYYVAVPDEAADMASRPGWLKFGEPNLPPPGIGAEHAIQPRAGRLALFPSYMWHGTNPITGDEPRLTIAFDVIPDEIPR